MDKASLLAELESVVRTMPDVAGFFEDSDEVMAWFGRAAAVLKKWNLVEATNFDAGVRMIHSPGGFQQENGVRKVKMILHQAANDLRMDTVGPVNVAIGQGGTFEYFDELRKVIGLATTNIFFIDPYLDADFVSKYLPQVNSGVRVRLLGLRYMPALVPAAKAFSEQSGLQIEVRASDGLHDRHIILDDYLCYQSGASFKDGARNANTIITQISDVATEVIAAYEKKWSEAAVKLS